MEFIVFVYLARDKAILVTIKLTIAEYSVSLILQVCIYCNIYRKENNYLNFYQYINFEVRKLVFKFSVFFTKYAYYIHGLIYWTGVSTGTFVCF